jgi:uracil-DNA glycosylase
MDTEDATTFDFALDERQRHMLEAMGIQVWQPAALLAPAGSSAGSSPALEEKPQNKPLAPVNIDSLAINTIANRNTATTSALPSSTVRASAAPALSAALSPAPSRPVEAPRAAPSSVSLTPRPAGIEQMDWPALQSAVSGCQACSLCASRKNTVFGVGQAPADALQAPQVDWLIVGEAPGENEDLQGEPFVGQAGKLLDNMLSAMKIGKSVDGKPTALSRQSGVYIANVLKCRPPANRNPSQEEVAMCEPYLARQIELLRPKIILAMGKFAIQSLTGSNDPVGKLRGRVHTLKHASYAAPVIVTYHPAYLLRNLPDKAKAWADLLLAMQTYSELATSAD